MIAITNSTYCAIVICTYAQIRGNQEMCPYCQQMFINRSKHWCNSCPAMVYKKKYMLDYVTIEQSIVQYVELVVATINSQDNRRYKELLQLLRNFYFISHFHCEHTYC